MGIGDWIILAALAVLAFFAIRYWIRHRGSCGSCGNCQSCAGCMKKCEKRKPPNKEN